MSFRINTPQVYINSFSERNDILNPQGFTIQNNIYDIGFRKSSYGQGKWIVIPSSVTSTYTTPEGKLITYITSTDGTNWTGVAGGPALFDGGDDTSANTYCRYVDILYSNNVWVAVSQAGTTTRAISSPDGINWTRRDTSGGALGASTAPSLNGIYYAQGQFVIVGGNSSAPTNLQKIFTSPDGSTWTGRTIFEDQLYINTDISATRAIWQSVAYGNNTWVAVASNASSSLKRVIISTDGGVKWYSPNSLTSAMNTKNWQRITYGNNIFVAVSYDNSIATSIDGITWTLQTFPTGQGLFLSVSFGNGIFMAVTDGPASLIYKSSDGLNWTLVPSQANNQILYGVTYANNIWIVNAQNGIQNRIFKLDYINKYYSSLQWISPYKEIRLRDK